MISVNYPKSDHGIPNLMLDPTFYQEYGLGQPPPLS